MRRCQSQLVKIRSKDSSLSAFLSVSFQKRKNQYFYTPKSVPNTTYISCGHGRWHGWLKAWFTLVLTNPCMDPCWVFLCGGPAECQWKYYRMILHSGTWSMLQSIFCFFWICLVFIKAALKVVLGGDHGIQFDLEIQDSRCGEIHSTIHGSRNLDNQWVQAWKGALWTWQVS